MSTNDNVVSTTDVAPPKEPKSFRDLNKKQLLAAAEHFGTETEGNLAVLRADLEESGVTWEMYATAFKLPGYDAPQVEDQFVLPEPTDVEDWEDAEEKEVEVSEVVTAEPAKFVAAEKYLIKFIGENPYFEFGKYKFRQEKPYCVMPAEDAQRALVSEPDKFRQAFPAELQEFYG